MLSQDLLGLFIGLGFLLIVIGYLAHIWFHPQHHRFLAIGGSEGKASQGDNDPRSSAGRQGMNDPAWDTSVINPLHATRVDRRQGMDASPLSVRKSKEISRVCRLRVEDSE